MPRVVESRSAPSNRCSECSRPAKPGFKRCEHHLAYQRRWMKRRSRNGICIQCPEPAEPGKLRCKGHLAYHVKWVKKYRRQRTRAGLCIDCPYKRCPGSIRCFLCARKNRERTRKLKEKKNGKQAATAEPA